MLWVSKSHTGSRPAHEHYRTRPSLSAIIAGVSCADGLGLAARPGVREPADDPERQLHAAAVVFQRHASACGCNACCATPAPSRMRSSRRCWCRAALAPSVGPGWPAQASVPGPLQGLAQSAELGTAGLWARLRGGATRVVLLLADSVTGLLWPPVVAEREDQAAPWQRLFARARVAGPDWQHIRGVTSDGAQGLSALLGHTLSLGAAPALRVAHLAHLGG